MSVITAERTATYDGQHLIMQQELLSLSSRSRHHIIDDAEHNGLLTEQVHALKIAAEIEKVRRPA